MKSTASTLLRGVAMAATLAMAATTAMAQAYPSKPVKLIIGFGPGTGSDILGRVLAIKLGQALGQPVVIENKAGAGGIIGSESVIRAAPDGYTLLLGTNAMLITSPLLAPRPPYQIDKDFIAVGGVARTSMVMVTGVTPESPRNLQELVGRIKAGKTTFASAGAGTIGHLTTEMVLKQIGAQATHVPYKGSGQSLNDIMRGEILFASDTPAAALSLIRAGRLRALGVTGESRLASLPDTPTFIESDISDIRLYAWWGLFAPPGTPVGVVDTVGKALAQVIADAETAKVFSGLALEPFSRTSEELTSFGKSEFNTWRGFLSHSGIKLD
jgi:tripartite-type tricarboxylate transporter receptor subunit TctC